MAPATVGVRAFSLTCARACNRVQGGCNRLLYVTVCNRLSSSRGNVAPLGQSTPTTGYDVVHPAFLGAFGAVDPYYLLWRHLLTTQYLLGTFGAVEPFAPPPPTMLNTEEALA